MYLTQCLRRSLAKLPGGLLAAMLAGPLCAGAAGATAITGANGAATAYPAKPIALMVPYPAGGASDAIARVLSQPIGKQLGQTVLVENLGGVSGAIGAQKVLSAPGDGYHLFQGSPNEVILSPLANAAVKLQAEDFQLVQPISTAVLALIARKDLEANSADELIALARSRKDKPLSYGSVGVGSLYHILAEHMQQLTGTRMTHVPYKGAAPLVQDLGGGQLDFAIVPFNAALGAMAQQGRLKLLATAGATRAPLLPNVPTISEGKLLKNFAFTIWTGFMVKKGTPPEVMQRLNLALGNVLKDPAVRAGLEAQMQIVATPMTLQEAARFYEGETARYRGLAKAIGLQPQ
ncbi:tripartite tricarboxylate transporter substrate binding protein [Cupriavidus oxalaticus]|jgi:tripartite-type tricarboxylate transporter receptor subunit TctC|uniref:Extra-cytoplasmic solute receptor n=1 Tax=Cupriavidus oxalaticus TaxID=96344 RepID=A0A375FQZ1_9BURK|nr:tripartite tricarboxylate transporter substrate binding protein [Cupriavidus oxalaticus]QRQ88984.1 tripartite tricarboxylate transporter substrate binding protein [Cupriavidus oxalaticus]QRQ92690.1 tripartite tricarboxylate transporter substrate binding protein [Cupriavidus oxalaticus]WQD81293.1 tripartite tricarboxylate transporter substrate binding protein [Cupriavidus oxalaticus]SPC06432.1 Extra-cytoplasmic solute receptor [Cupriavidus oxalaticus]SPC12585.1 Extra-cytoplasmic solute recep